MSDGVSCVLTVTYIPSKLIGGATSPPKPCPKTSVTSSGTENIPINIITKGTVKDNYLTIAQFPYLKMLQNYQTWIN